MDTTNLRKGLKIMMDGQPYVVVEHQFVKPGKGVAFVRTKMKHLLTGGTLEKNIRSGEKLEPADVEDRDMQFIYPEGETFVFMNTASGEQIIVSADAMGDSKDFLMDGLECTITLYKGNPVSVSLPPHVIVQVVETEPGAKGDTATNVQKPATLTTGAQVGVPLFINEGEWIKVDTRERKYLERAKDPTAG